jgi:D-threo-aldose 1-dehydrogenase
MPAQSSNSSLQLPLIIFGTSGLGNLYVALPLDVKQAIVSAFVQHSTKPAVFDSAGKYGAGLALESLGQCLKKLNVHPKDVLISNKLGWLRTELKAPEPTFEPGVWHDLKYDAIQKISYDGILECYKQGNELLGDYETQFVSVHDPDEYLAAATDDADDYKRYQDILEAYLALTELKAQGKATAVGIGAKNWKVIERLNGDVKLDWVMIANSMTVHSHPADLLKFMHQLRQRGTVIINSAVFNAGFLTGGDYYNYQLIDILTAEGQALYQWRTQFYKVCKEFGVEPAAACVHFGLAAPGVSSIALSTSNIKRIPENFNSMNCQIPSLFWNRLYTEGLISQQGLVMMRSS